MLSRCCPASLSSSTHYHVSAGLSFFFPLISPVFLVSNFLVLRNAFIYDIFFGRHFLIDTYLYSLLIIPYVWIAFFYCFILCFHQGLRTSRSLISSCMFMYARAHVVMNMRTTKTNTTIYGLVVVNSRTIQ
ncbi:hypothetical protein BJ912DRAFT_522518 [Pholiota molesta]|nr:hypothetical protein BJ912DRAFT_522518 [Pholiota molesta]